MYKKDFSLPVLIAFTSLAQTPFLKIHVAEVKLRISSSTNLITGFAFSDSHDKNFKGFCSDHSCLNYLISSKVTPIKRICRVCHDLCISFASMQNLYAFAN